ncbi:putative cobalt transporter in sulfate-reducing delta-proteobacteria [Methanosarcina sp. Kolksee]|uniref:hypothetical protein n=1 Tax=Methanosarcina sp. Kolksee TaxID=1434099 RepID=UPI0006158E29|nr:hypothetical protein [Methanosarcina sp. Kolksee]AKB47444.1 putative cobalt transporter in sulfate-reducing delta-proteobacteria [Methanosarcina sp. Kolksee]
MVIASVVRAVELWISVFPFTVAGILMASTTVEFGIFGRLFSVMKPTLHRAHFTFHSGIALMTALGSPITAVAMISEFYGEGNDGKGKINRKETSLTTVATWFPQTIYEILVYISPIIIFFLGVVGIAYISLFILNSTIVALLAFTAGIAFLVRKECLSRKDCEFVSKNKSQKFVFENKSPKIVFRATLKQSVLNSVSLLKRIVLFAFPVSIFVFVLIDPGIFDTVSQNLEWILLPPEALATIPLVIASPAAAYVTITDLLEAKVPDFKLALQTLLAGNFLVSTRYILTHRLPVLFRNFRAGAEPENNLSKRRFEVGIDNLNNSCSDAGLMKVRP